MGLFGRCRALLSLALISLVLCSSLLVNYAHSSDSEDSHIFIVGFNAFQKKDYKTAIEQMTTLLEKYPGSQLQDTALFWLARAHFKAGNRNEAGRYMAQFLRDYPTSPLKGTVEEGLVALARDYEQSGQPLPPPSIVVAAPVVELPATLPQEPPAVVATAPPTPPPAHGTPPVVEEAPLLAPAPVKDAAKPVSRPSVASTPSRKGKKGAATAHDAGPTGQKYRDLALADYKRVIDRFPGTRAAAEASSKLLALGVVYPGGDGYTSTTAPGPVTSGAQVFAIEIGQTARAELTVPQSATVGTAGSRVTIPWEIVNQGNGSDSFSLSTDFPEEFTPHFSHRERPDHPLAVTPVLAPGESFKGGLTLSVPRGVIDGQKILHALKVTSALNRQVSATREVPLVASAPLVRTVIKADKAEVYPGERVSYRVSVLNIGSAIARGLTLRLSFPPQYEPVDVGQSGLRQEVKSVLVHEGLTIASGENRDFTVTFQLKDDALARQELFCRADITNSELNTSVSFLSGTSTVRAVSGVALVGRSSQVVAVPGQVVSFPLLASNKGNQRESFSLKHTVPDALKPVFYLDSNRDGIRQDGEPAVNQVGPLNPREEVALILQLSTPVSSPDRSELTVTSSIEAEGDREKRASAMSRITFARPLVQLVMVGRDGKLVPGDVSSFDLVCINSGSNLARTVEVRSLIPPQLEVVTAEPGPASSTGGEFLWRFSEMGAGEQRSIRVSFRVKPGIAAGTGVQLKNLLTYEDQLGTRY